MSDKILDMSADHFENEYVDDLEKHVFTKPVSSVPPVILLEDKLKYEVYRKGSYSMLKMPPDVDFIRREGIDMHHCLTYLHESYCAAVIDGNIELYSLIDNQTGDPKVDVEVALIKDYNGRTVEGPTVVQVRGKANECPPKKQFLPILVEFFGRNSWWWRDKYIRNFDGKMDGYLTYCKFNGIEPDTDGWNSADWDYSDQLLEELYHQSGDELVLSQK